MVYITKVDTTYPILYRSRRQKKRELKGNYNQISLLNQILVKGEIDHKVQRLGSAKTYAEVPLVISKEILLGNKSTKPEFQISVPMQILF